MNLSTHSSSLHLAFEDLKAQVLLNRDDINAYILLGTVLRWQKKLKQAFELHYNLLVHPKLRGENIYRLNLELGYDLLELRKKDFGLSFFNHATRSKKHRPMALEGIAMAHTATGKPENAIAQLEELVKFKQPHLLNVETIFVSAAKNLRVGGDTARAQKLLEKVIASRNSSGLAMIELMHVYLQTELYDKVAPLVRKGLQDFPAYSKTYLVSLEDVYFGKGIYSQFEEALRKLLFDFPTNPEIFFSLAKHLSKKKKIKEALSVIEKGLENTPSHINLFKLYVEISALANTSHTVLPKLDVFLQNLRA